MINSEALRNLEIVRNTFKSLEFTAIHLLIASITTEDFINKLDMLGVDTEKLLELADRQAKVEYNEYIKLDDANKSIKEHEKIIGYLEEYSEQDDVGTALFETALKFNRVKSIVEKTNTMQCEKLLSEVKRYRNVTVQDVSESAGVGLDSLMRGLGCIVIQSEMPFVFPMQLGAENKQDRSDYKNINIPKCLREVEKQKYLGSSALMDRTIRIINKSERKNVIIVGDRGVGKKAIVRGIRQLQTEKEYDTITHITKGLRLYSLDCVSLVSNTGIMGGMESKLLELENCMAELSDKLVIVIEDINDLIVRGSQTNALHSILDYAERNCVAVIACSTEEDYTKHITGKASMESRFTRVSVTEPSKESCMEIIRNRAIKLEDYYEIKFSDEVLNLILSMGSKYIKTEANPSKALNIMDLAGNISFCEKNIRALEGSKSVTKEHVYKAVADITGINVEDIMVSDNNRLKNLEKTLKGKVFGQEESLNKIIKHIKIGKAGMIRENKPIASFLLLGQTGVGKTETARALESALNIPLIKLDMSEYSEQFSVSKLVGSAPGYVGYEDCETLVDRVRRNPECILLLDEIEKANGTVFDVLLQVLDDAKMTSSRGYTADFSNTIIIMTSNAGATGKSVSSIGFNSSDITNEMMKNELQKSFRPEFLGRISEILMYNGIDNKEVANQIVKKMLSEIKDGLLKKGIKLKYSSSVINHLSSKQISLNEGARQLERYIKNEISYLISDKIIENELKEGSLLKIGITKGEINITVE